MKFSTVFSAVCIVGLPSLASFLPAKRDMPRAVSLINFALSLEHLEHAFYKQGLAQYSREDFIKAGYAEWVRERFEQILGHEKTHVEFLSAAVTGAGAKAAKPCEYMFPHHDVTSFIKLSVALEQVGTSAYNGALGPLSDSGSKKEQYVTVAGSILVDEARHAAWINSAVLKSYPWSTSFETPLTANQAYTMASAFVKACPPENPPPIAKAFPKLTMSPSAPGKRAQFSFDLPKNFDGMPLYAAFITGTRTSFVQINDKNEVVVPKDLFGTVYVVITSDGGKVTDETTVAGPTMAMYSYPSGVDRVNILDRR